MSIIAGIVIFDVPQKYPFRMLDNAINIIAGQVTLIASMALTSFMPYLPIKGANINTKIPITIAHTILNTATVFIVFIRFPFSCFSAYTAEIFDMDADIPADIIQIKRLYIGITKLYNPIPSGPNTCDRYIENMNPNIPVVIFEAVSKNEFLKKLSFSKAIHSFRLQ